MGEASAVTAQRLANQTNKDIASDANALNLQMMREQNQWNLDQWNRENEYNSPAAQMQRLIEAGINPVFAAGNITGGQAGQLTAADWPGAQTYEAKPEYDPFEQQRLGNIIAASRDVMNAGLGFGRLGLQAEDVNTRKAAQITRSELDKASAAELRAATVGRNISNEWNAASFQTRLHEEGQKLKNMEAEEEKYKADTELSKAKKLESDEERKLISSQVNSVIASIRQRDEELRIAMKNANTNQQNAATNFYNAETNRKNFMLVDERFSAEVRKWNNDTLLQYMYKFGKSFSGQAEASFGSKKLGPYVGGKVGLQHLEPATISEARACGLELYQRCADNPTAENREAAEKAAPFMREIDEIVDSQLQRLLHPFVYDHDTSNSSVLNPSGF